MLRRREALAAASAAVLLPGCAALGPLDVLVPRDTYERQAGVAYGPLVRQKLDVYLPLQRTAGMPLLVFFYGGAWTRGERGDYRFVGEALASQGIATLVADYRLSPQVRWPQILEDCAAATAWAFANAQRLGCAAERVFLMGHSAGAYNAAMLALDARWLAAHGLRPRQLAGWIGLAGPYDFLPITSNAARVAFDWPDTPADSQPIVHVSGEAPRALLLAPRKDATVDPQRNTVGLGERLQAAGVPVRMKLLAEVSHITIVAALARPLARLGPVRQEVTQFVLEGTGSQASGV
jgi:acetyl esterase/lipase